MSGKLIVGYKADRHELGSLSPALCWQALQGLDFRLHALRMRHCVHRQPPLRGFEVINGWGDDKIAGGSIPTQSFHLGGVVGFGLGLYPGGIGVPRIYLPERPELAFRGALEEGVE